MRIAIGCDHRGLNLKRFIIKLITEAEHSYEDFGCYTTDSVDYPDIARRVAEAVASGDFECGILQDTVREIVNTFLTSEFEGGRHLRRLNKIKAMEG